MDKKWSEEDCLNLIAEYKKQLIQREVNGPNLHNNQEIAAWQTIGKNMDCDPDVCRNKMISLLASFRRSKSNMLRYLKSTDKEHVDVEGVCQSTWHRFKELSCMFDRDPELTVLMRLWEEVKHNSTDLAKKERITQNSDGPNPDTASTASQTTGDSRLSITPEIKAFTSYIAAKMNNYSEQTKNMVQQNIFEIIWKADQAEYCSTRDYNNESSKKRKLNTSEDTHPTCSVEPTPTLKTIICTPTMEKHDAKQKKITSPSHPNTLRIIPEACCRNIDTPIFPNQKTAVIAPRVTRSNFTYIPSSSRSPSPTILSTSEQITCANPSLPKNHIITPILRVLASPITPNVECQVNKSPNHPQSSFFTTPQATMTGPIISNVISMRVPDSDKTSDAANKNVSQKGNYDESLKCTTSDETSEEVNNDSSQNNAQKDANEESPTNIKKSTSMKIQYESDDDDTRISSFLNTANGFGNYDLLVEDEKGVWFQ